MCERHREPEKRHGRGFAAGLVIVLIRVYQLSLSMLMGRRCRFLPTCSDYAMEAVARYGAVDGGRLALRRVSRCHPWGGEGFDPVPDELPWRRKQ
jgi:putative membrane protein insertion efficiency factor